MKKWINVVVDAVVYVASIIGCYVSCCRLASHIQDITDDWIE